MRYGLVGPLEAWIILLFNKRYY